MILFSGSDRVLVSFCRKSTPLCNPRLGSRVRLDPLSASEGRRLRFWIWPLVVQLGCATKKKQRQDEPQARQEVAEAWARKLPYVLQARFNITVKGPDSEGTTIGAMILHHPNRVRLDVQTPLQTPMLLMASDGTGLNLWLHRDGVFLKGDDALQVLEAVTGGAIGLDDLLSLLTAGLPLEGAEVLNVGWVDDRVQVRLQGAENVYVDALLDSKLDTVRSLNVSRELPGEESEPELLMRVDVPDLMHVGRHRLPEEMTIELPSVGWAIELEVHTWDELGVVPEVFSLKPPAGAEIRDLVETVRALAESQGVHPPE